MNSALLTRKGGNLARNSAPSGKRAAPAAAPRARPAGHGAWSRLLRPPLRLSAASTSSGAPRSRSHAAPVTPPASG